MGRWVFFCLASSDLHNLSSLENKSKQISIKFLLFMIVLFFFSVLCLLPPEFQFWISKISFRIGACSLCSRLHTSFPWMQLMQLCILINSWWDHTYDCKIPFVWYVFLIMLSFTPVYYWHTKILLIQSCQKCFSGWVACFINICSYTHKWN